MEMKIKKKENEQAHLISPVVKKSKAIPKVGNFDELVENNTRNHTEMELMTTNKKLKVEESKLSMDESRESDLSDHSSEK